MKQELKKRFQAFGEDLGKQLFVNAIIELIKYAIAALIASNVF